MGGAFRHQARSAETDDSGPPAGPIDSDGRPERAPTAADAPGPAAATGRATLLGLSCKAGGAPGILMEVHPASSTAVLVVWRPPASQWRPGWAF